MSYVHIKIAHRHCEGDSLKQSGRINRLLRSARNDVKIELT